MKEKLRQYADFKGISHRKFSMSLGKSDKFISFEGGFNSEIIPILRNKYPDLNMEWVLFGEGEMILSSDTNNLTALGNTRSIVPNMEDKLLSQQYQYDMIYKKLQELEKFKEIVLIKFELQEEFQNIMSNLLKEGGRNQG